MIPPGIGSSFKHQETRSCNCGLFAVRSPRPKRPLLQEREKLMFKTRPSLVEDEDLPVNTQETEAVGFNSGAIAAAVLMGLLGTILLYVHHHQNGGGVGSFSFESLIPEGYSFKQSLVSGGVAGISRGLSRSKSLRIAPAIAR